MAHFHSYISGIADGADSTVVRPTDWNAAHVDKTVKYVELVVDPAPVDCTTGDGRFFFHVPPILDLHYLTYVFAMHGTAGQTAGPFEGQLWNMADSVDMLVQPISIDAGELYSSDATTVATISSDADTLIAGDIIRVDVDVLPTTAPKGYTITLGFTPNEATTD